MSKICFTSTTFHRNHFATCCSALEHLGAVADQMPHIEQLFTPTLWAGSGDSLPAITQSLQYMRGQVESSITEFTTWRRQLLSMGPHTSGNSQSNESDATKIWQQIWWHRVITPLASFPHRSTAYILHRILWPGGDADQHHSVCCSVACQEKWEKTAMQRCQKRCRKCWSQYLLLLQAATAITVCLNTPQQHCTCVYWS